MKRFFLLGFFLLGLSLGASPTHAQFTLLPQAPADVDCIPILQQYELDGKIPTRAQIVDEQTGGIAGDFKDFSADPANIVCLQNDPQFADQCESFNDAKDASEQVEEAGEGDDQAALLGCAIKTGRISLQMLPYFITYMANFLLAMSGIVSVLFIVVGGYLYIYGGLVDQKERGKKYLINALVGLSLATVSWSLVTFIINAITS